MSKKKTVKGILRNLVVLYCYNCGNSKVGKELLKQALSEIQGLVKEVIGEKEDKVVYGSFTREFNQARCIRNELRVQQFQRLSELSGKENKNG